MSVVSGSINIKTIEIVKMVVIICMTKSAYEFVAPCISKGFSKGIYKNFQEPIDNFLAKHES